MRHIWFYMGQRLSSSHTILTLLFSVLWLMDGLEKNKNPILAIITERKMRTICGRLCAKIAGGDGGSDGVTVILWFYSKRVSLQLSLIEMQIWVLHQNTSDYYGPCPPSHKRARCVVSALQSPGMASLAADKLVLSVTWSWILGTQLSWSGPLCCLVLSRHFEHQADDTAPTPAPRKHTLGQRTNNTWSQKFINLR